MPAYIARRNLTVGTCRLCALELGACLLSFGAASCQTSGSDVVGPGSNGPPPTIQTENTRAGTADWIAPPAEWAATTDLALYASPYAASPGDTLTVRISSTVPGALKITAYRMGWYGGAGARLVWSGHVAGAPVQPACGERVPGPSECPWSPTLTIPVGSDWPSGVYVIRAENAVGKFAYYPLVVRSGVSQP